MKNGWKRVQIFIGLMLTLALLGGWQSAVGATLDADKKMISDWVDGNKDKITRLSNAIWSYAELGMQEHRSSKALMEYLKSEGFKVESGVAGMPTAFVASWGSGKPAIGFLAEYDALPMVNNKAVPRQEPFVDGAPGHGCGHNLYGTGSTAAAVALKTMMERKKIPGSVYLFGTPAEETVDAKVFMHEAGLFKVCDALMMWHPVTENFVDTGTNLAMFSAHFQFKGKTAHAARTPEMGRSALDAIELMNAGVNVMREHIPMETRVHYVITKGGVQPNVVPDSAESWYYIRHPKIEEAARVYDWIIDIAKGAALMTQTQMTYVTDGYDYNKLTNVAGSRIMYENLNLYGVPSFTAEEEVFAKGIQRELKEKEVGINKEISPFQEKGVLLYASNDVGAASWATPLVSLGLAGQLPGVPGHHWGLVAVGGMSIGHKFMLTASKVMAATGLDLVTNPENLKKMRTEFVEKTKDFKERRFVDKFNIPVDQYKAEAANWDKLLQPYHKNP